MRSSLKPSPKPIVVSDPVAAGAGGEPDERWCVEDPDVGEAVGEQEDLADSFGALELLIL